MKTCPLLKKPCIEHQCMFWRPIHMEKATVEGPQPITEWDCSLTWNIFLSLEQAKQFRGIAGSMDKAANEIQAGAGSILWKMIGGWFPGEQRRLK